MSNIIWFDKISMQDVGKVGGKNASLGEMITHLTSQGVSVPHGFATTAEAYRNFLHQNNLDKKIADELKKINRKKIATLKQAGKNIRRWIINAKFSPTFHDEIVAAFKQLTKLHPQKFSVAVRSSATAEDLPGASFAGQQETYLNVSTVDELLLALKKVFASLYTDRAIIYREEHGFAHEKVALSAGVQYMVRSDLAASGVMFTIDTESGFADVVFITAAFGLGETIVQGEVNPDEYILYKPNLTTKRPAILSKKIGTKAIKMVYAAKNKIKTVAVKSTDATKFALTDDELHELARYALLIEQHYQRPMDIEWAKDGVDGKLYIVQARPETGKSHINRQVIEQYELISHGKTIAQGRSVGDKIGKGKACILRNAKEIAKFKAGDVLVTDMTDPDWEPIMKQATAIVTNRGGRTCHAAIIAREIGIPAVVGCGNATKTISHGENITVSCLAGEIGYVYQGLADFKVKPVNVTKMPTLPVKVMLNIADPSAAFSTSFLPNDGIGLTRIEFIISNMIGIHPKAALNFAKLNAALKKQINNKIIGYRDPVSFYVKKLKEGIATIAAAFYPKPVIVRTSDFKSNEYANLIGGELYEPKEENPMLGFRGASRYVSEMFSDCFALECQALREVRDEMGLTNVQVMIPFTRTVAEAQNVLQLLAKHGLERGKNDLKIIMMCEIPSNVILAEEFLQQFDGFSIGSNDLTQLTLGLDRDSMLVANLFDERNEAVKSLLAQVIAICNKMNKYIGICGQAPSDYPDFAQWLLQQKIGSISLNPDTVVKTWLKLNYE